MWVAECFECGVLDRGKKEKCSEVESKHNKDNPDHFCNTWNDA